MKGAKLFCVLPLLLWVFPVFALTVDVPLADSVQEERAKDLFHEIRCMVCQSETIADSHAEVAKDMRRDVRKKIEQGMSEEEIKADLASRYGNVILMKPPVNENTMLLWFGPWLVLMLGGISVYFYFRNTRSSTKS